MRLNIILHPIQFIPIYKHLQPQSIGNFIGNLPKIGHNENRQASVI